MAAILRRGAARIFSAAAACRTSKSSCLVNSEQVHRLLPQPLLSRRQLHSLAPELLCHPSSRSFSTVAAAPPSGITPDVQAEIDHAAGLEREELVGEATGKPRFDLAPPQGPFGTVEAPAVIESYFNERLVGCSGGIGEEEHDVVWFRLKKDTGHECSVCGQVFQLKVIGDGGSHDSHH